MIILALVPVAGRGVVGGDPQAQRLHRPVRLIAEIFPADPGALHQLDPAGQDVVRLGLAGDQARPKVLKANARRLLGIQRRQRDGAHAGREK